MKPILAPLLALTALSGCDIHGTCDTLLTGARTAQEIAAVLVSHGVLPEIAAKIGNALAIGETTVAVACAAIPASPVATPGQ